MWLQILYQVMGGPPSTPLIRKVKNIHSPLEIIHAELCYFGIIEKECIGKGPCNDLHCVGKCEAFKQILQDLLDQQKIQVGFLKKEENISTIQSSSNKNMYTRRPKAITIQVVENYNLKVQNNPDVTNISGNSGMTRSGHIYTPDGLGSGKLNEEEKINKRKSKEDELVEKNMGKRALSEQEACEFFEAYETE